MRSSAALVGLSFVAFLGALVGCAEEPPPAAPPAPPVETSPAVATASAAPSAAELTPDQKQRAEALKELESERVKWSEQKKIDLGRWTAERHAAAKALADKNYPSGRAALQAAVAGSQRKPGASDRDKYRHPLETLTFFGFDPKMTVLDVYPGEGWYTELLAPSVASQGKLVEATPDPHGPGDNFGTFYAQRFQEFLGMAPELYGKVKTIVIDPHAPALALDGTVDMVLLMREVHNMVPGRPAGGTLGSWLAQIHKALKPRGILGIEDHRAPAGADPIESAKKGYLPEKWVIDQVEAAGFKLAGKSEINSNPKDTKDYPEGVWSLPPSFEADKKDHDKYAAIGESDRMTLKFVKVVAKPEAKAH